MDNDKFLSCRAVRLGEVGLALVDIASLVGSL